MPTVSGSLRRLLLTPSFRSISFAGRAFPVVPGDATRRLEAIPQAVVVGFEWGMDVRDLWEIECRLELVEPEMRGFAYEGATMAFTVRDSMAGGRGHRTRDLLRGPGVPHTFLTYIGIGFAMARLPRPLWKSVLPDLTGTPYYPTMSWLAVDGYGFDRAYFDTEQFVAKQRRPAAYPWLGHPEYFSRAVDQGIGRALWFIHGGRSMDVAASVGAFAVVRQADLWSGVGLAATFAGGCAAEDLRALCQKAGELGPHLAQGAVFAAKARDFSGYVPDHTEMATEVFAGMPVTAAAALADDVAAGGFTPGDQPDYELWRERVRDHFQSESPIWTR
jgi:hypothetical protein